jgi:hypothetical protein
MPARHFPTALMGQSTMSRTAKAAELAKAVKAEDAEKIGKWQERVRRLEGALGLVRRGSGLSLQDPGSDG